MNQCHHHAACHMSLQCHHTSRIPQGSSNTSAHPSTTIAASALSTVLYKSELWGRTTNFLHTKKRSLQNPIPCPGRPSPNASDALDAGSISQGTQADEPTVWARPFGPDSQRALVTNCLDVLRQSLPTKRTRSPHPRGPRLLSVDPWSSSPAWPGIRCLLRSMCHAT